MTSATSFATFQKSELASSTIIISIKCIYVMRITTSNNTLFSCFLIKVLRIKCKKKKHVMRALLLHSPLSLKPSNVPPALSVFCNLTLPPKSVQIGKSNVNLFVFEHFEIKNNKLLKDYSSFHLQNPTHPPHISHSFTLNYEGENSQLVIIFKLIWVKHKLVNVWSPNLDEFWMEGTNCNKLKGRGADIARFWIAGGI